MQVLVMLFSIFNVLAFHNFADAKNESAHPNPHNALMKTTKAAPCQLVNIQQINPSIVVDLRYATSENFTGTTLYNRTVCYVHQEVTEKLNAVQKDLQKENLGIKFWDGYRPLSIQQKMWDLIHDERYVANPTINKGRHTRGTAVDITLVDNDGNELEMPSEFDEFSEKAHRAYPRSTPTARTHLQKLDAVMLHYGFEGGNPYEWWHYDLIGWKDDVKYPALDLSLEELERAPSTQLQE
jgi:D-alanyl-D-alanine dipeptidase